MYSLRMFKTICDELFLKYPDGPVYDDLNETEQRRLCSGYILYNTDIVADILADIPPIHIATSLAVAVLTGACNGKQLSKVICDVAFPNQTLAQAATAELALRYRTWTRFAPYEEVAE